MLNLKSFFVGVLMLAFLLFICSISFAEDYKTPHKFKPGDVISADMMNEIFDYIRNAKRSVTASDLVGAWNCSAYHNGSEITDAAPGWTLSKDKLIMRLENVAIIFTDDGDETYSLSTSISASNPFYHTDSTAVNTNYEVNANTIYMNVTSSLQASFSMEMISETRIVCNVLKAQGSDTTPLLIFDKQNLPPVHPTNLTATTSERNVFLSWTDNSSDETNFKIDRKDTLKGTYSEIGTASANAISYSDVVPAEGKYWYRVKATNANGDSLGSNVVKVKVSQ